MANYSSLTRRDQVLFKLQSAEGGWVDGPELANERIGGSEGLKRLRELREELGYDIRKRKHPNPQLDIFQYRLVPSDAHGPASFGQQVVSNAEGQRITALAAIPIEPAEVYEYKQPPRQASRVHLGVTEEGKYVAVSDAPPLPGQTTITEIEESDHHKFKAMPTHLDMAKMKICPLCKGYRRPIRERDPVTRKQLKNGKILSYEEKSRDPDKPAQDCRWCDGWGVVPL